MKDLEKSKLVCQEICEDGTSYQQLDARKYLSLMEKEIIYMKQNHMSTSNNIEKDVIKHEPQPWRRYFARQMDYVFYGVLWEFIFSILFRQRYQLESGWIFRMMVMFVPTIILMVFIEPLFLSIFGTTPGKWVYGNLDDEIIVALYSFACAQPKMNTIQVYKFMDGIKGKLENGNGFSCNIGNVEVDCNQELDAFESYKVTFSMKL